VLGNFQDSLLAENIRPQTVNDNMKAVRRIFKYLARKGLVKTNPCRETDAIAVRQSDRVARGCYEIDRLKGVFACEWEDEVSYLLCLLIYTTGMRNSEISRLRADDIITENGCYFIDIKESKTRCGVRLVPLHGFVYGKLAAFFRGKAADAGVSGE
jgi:site-specific recombinase XerD